MKDMLALTEFGSQERMELLERREIKMGFLLMGQDLSVKVFFAGPHINMYEE